MFRAEAMDAVSKVAMLVFQGNLVPSTAMTSRTDEVTFIDKVPYMETDFPKETIDTYKLNRGGVEIYEIYINADDMDIVASMPDDTSGCVDPRTAEPRKCPVAGQGKKIRAWIQWWFVDHAFFDSLSREEGDMIIFHRLTKTNKPWRELLEGRGGESLEK